MGPARLRKAAPRRLPTWPIDSVPVTASWPPLRVYDPLPPFPYWSTSPMTRLATVWVPPICVKLPTAAKPWLSSSLYPINSLPFTVRRPPPQGIRSAAAIFVCVAADEKAGHGVGPAGLRETARGSQALTDRLGLQSR